MDSWAQEGRNKKAQELAKSEEYAVRAVGKPRKNSRKKYHIQYRYTEAYLKNMREEGCNRIAWMYPSDWVHYQSYATERAMQEALRNLTDKSDWFDERMGCKTREYRVAPTGC